MALLPRSRRLCALVMLSAAGLACESATDTGFSNPSLTILSHIDSVNILSGTSGGADFLRCHITYEMQPVAEEVKWGDVTFSFHFGADRTLVGQSFFVPGDSLRNSWKSEQRRGMTILGSKWEFGAEVPFSVSAEMRYQIGGRPFKVATPRFSCGPEPRPTDALPVVTGTVTPLTDLRRGSEVRVRYQVSSTVGLWETSVHITGAFRKTIRKRDGFSRNVTYEDVIIIGSDAVVGQPVHIAISSTDVAQRNSTISFSSAVIR